MSRLVVWMILVLHAAVPSASAERPVRPDSLLNWLRLIDADDFKLLNAVDQNGHYFAVKLDSDGDMLFCSHEHTATQTDSPRQFSLVVLDPDGQDLHDPDSTKRSPRPLKRTYSSREVRGPLTTRSSVTIAYDAGMIYALRDHKFETLHVRYAETLENGTESILFEQRIQLPDGKKPPKSVQ